MKNPFQIKRVLMPFFIILFTIPVFIQTAAAVSHENKESGISFTVPDGWAEQTPSEKSNDVSGEVIFSQAEETGEMIGYFYLDLWEEQTDNYKLFHKRVSMTDSSFTDDDLLKELKKGVSKDEEISLDSASKENYNNIPYRKYIFTVPVDGETVKSINVICMIRIEKGICHSFLYGYAPNFNTHMADYETLMGSISYSEPELILKDEDKTAILGNMISDYIVGLVSNGNLPKTLLSLFLTLILTITVYCLPIILYRYFIRKKPMDRKNARRLVIIYGSILFLTDTAVTIFIAHRIAFSLFPAVFWSIINYKMLVTGLDRTYGGYAQTVKRAMMENTDDFKQLSKHTDEYQRIISLKKTIIDETDSIPEDNELVDENSGIRSSYFPRSATVTVTLLEN